MFDRLRVLCVGGVLGLIAGAGSGGVAEIDPRGVFFHSYTGSFSAVEWVHIRTIEGDRRYEFSDIRGIAPYAGTITTDGQITWDTLANQSGSGSFTSQDDATQTLNYFGDAFASTMRRAPGTDANFVTQIGSRENGSELANGSWSVRIDRLDAATGDLLSSEDTSATTVVTGDLLRITLEGGTYYQGVFETPTTAGFRVVLPRSGVPLRFRSFDGSETNLTENVLGDFRMTGDDSFAAVMLQQNRAQPGNQVQSVYRISATRVPTPAGLGLLGVGSVFAARRRR